VGVTIAVVVIHPGVVFLDYEQIRPPMGANPQ